MSWVVNEAKQMLEEPKYAFVTGVIRDRLLWLLEETEIREDDIDRDVTGQVELDKTLAYLQPKFAEILEESQTYYDRKRGAYILKNKYADEMTKTGAQVKKSDTLLEAEMDSDESFVKAKLDIAAKKRLVSILDKLSFTLKDRMEALAILNRRRS